MNKPLVRKSLFRLLFFSVAMAAIGVIYQYLLPKFASPAIPFIVIFFFLITLLTLCIVFKKSNQPTGRKFVTGYILSRIIKIFSILIFLVLYILCYKDDRWNFAGAFLVIYFSYSIFEIIVLNKEK